MVGEISTSIVSIQVYCERCKKTEQISVDYSDPDVKYSIDQGSGLHSFSLLHKDHSLVVKIDGKGAARRVDYFDLISEETESYYSTTLANIQPVIGKEVTVFILTKNNLIRSYLKGVLRLAIVNNLGEITVESQDQYLSFQINELQFYCGAWTGIAKSLRKKNNFFYFEVTDEELPKEFNINKEGLAVLYNLQYLVKSNLQQNLSKMITKYSVKKLDDFRSNRDLSLILFDNYFKEWVKTLN